MTQPSFRDVELLSGYLDGELTQADSTRLEMRLKADPQLRTVYDELNQSRSLLRQLPARRAPRNFMLTPKMAGVKPPLPRGFPILRLASALAAVLFFFGYVANITVPALSTQRAAAPAPAFGRGGGGPPNPQAESAAAPAATAFAAPAATEAPAATQASQDNAVFTPTPEGLRVVAAPTEASTELAPIAPPQANKTIPNIQQVPVEPVLAAQELPIPSVVLVGLLILAVLAGAAALFLLWQAERKFKQRKK